MGMRQDYKAVVFSGCAIEYKNISLCDLRQVLSQYGRYTTGVYQVHSDNSRCRFSKIFQDLDEAVDKFIELKGLAR